MSSSALCLSLFCTGLMTLGALSSEAEGPIVRTKYGEVQGVSGSVSGSEYEAFYGIPFASSTAGESRWKFPQPPKPWEGIRNGTEFGPYCPQLVSVAYPILELSDVQDEDCLNANVYVPGGVDKAYDLPVMVWMYGGAFLLGVTDMYPGEDLAVTGKVIVVTVNYRVGTLGFLSTGDRYAEGNYGLYDQVEALRWVQDNIQFFGGDKHRVTIFGQSAGGASVSHLSLSPLTKNLFRRMIALSGSATAYFAHTEAQPQSTAQTAMTVLCPRLNNENQLNCLRRRGPTILDLAGLAAPLVLGRRIPNWVPRVDGYLVSEEPRRALHKGWSKDIDILTGFARHDAAFIVYLNPLGMGYGKWINIAKNVSLLTSGLRLMLTPYENAEELYDLVIAQYPDILHDDLETRTKAAVQALTDFLFASPAILEADVHSRLAQSTNRRTFVYEFAHRQNFVRYENWVEASHCDDLYSVFGERFLDPFRRKFLRRAWRKDDVAMKELTQKYYANFAYSGNPNEGPHDMEVEWPAYNEESRNFMELTTTPTAKSHNEGGSYERFNFWIDRFYWAAIPTTEKDAPSIGDQIDNARQFLALLKNILEAVIERVGEGDTTVFTDLLTQVATWISPEEQSSFGTGTNTETP